MAAPITFRSLFPFGALLLLALPICGQQAVELVPGTASVEFRIRNAGFWVDGTLSGMQVKGSFSPEQPEQSRLEASVDAATIDTGISARDDHLKKEKYLHVSAHPEIKIRSRSIRREGDKWILEGALTIKGTTRDLRIPFDAQARPNGYLLTGSFSIDRLDFGVGGKSLILGNRVEVTIRCELDL